MPSTALRDYSRKLKALDNTRKRMDSLYSRKRVARHDIMSAYESLFLRAVVGFERFCEDLFFDIINQRVFYRRADVTVMLRRTINRDQNDVMRKIVFEGKNYVEWIPYEKALNRVGLHLNGGRPFAALDDTDKGTLKRIVLVRNAIAHASDYALAEFKRVLLSQINLLPVDRNPAGLLRSSFSGNPPRNYFQFYVVQLEYMANKIYGSPVR